MNQNLVHITEGGARYHQTSDCHAFSAGRMLNDFWDHEWPGTRRMPRMHAAETVDWKHAASQGKTPCLSCWPAAAMRYLPQPSGSDFGHRPVLGITDGRGLGRICARGCSTRTHPHSTWSHAPVAWPCTSAIVLGLTRRPHHPETR
ncbi:hypothetical protein [Streptomyces sp. NPDC050738]|uniref:hypothetical protein n=1 Tax=Streptomyces sp. NPDC050738 TaxID=3154744 RepID=UPI00344A42FE